MSAYETSPDVDLFTASLSGFARRNYQGGLVSHADLVKALSLGWPAKHMAAECSKNLPTARAYAVIQSRLSWFANNKPEQQLADAGRPKPAATPWCGRCDDASYRWIVDAAGQPVRPCPECSPQRAIVAHR